MNGTVFVWFILVAAFASIFYAVAVFSGRVIFQGDPVRALPDHVTSLAAAACGGLTWSAFPSEAGIVPVLGVLFGAVVVGLGVLRLWSRIRISGER